MARFASMSLREWTSPSHGRPIGIDQAKKQGLKITSLESDQELQERVLSLFHVATVTFEITDCVKIVDNYLGYGSYVTVKR